jgi:hypothetical protein
MLLLKTFDSSEPPRRFRSAISNGPSHPGANSTRPESVNGFRNRTARRLLSSVVPIVPVADGLGDGDAEDVEEAPAEAERLALGELLSDALPDALGEVLREALSDADGEAEPWPQKAVPIRMHTVVFVAGRALCRTVTRTHFVPSGSCVFSVVATVSRRAISLQVLS